MENKKIYVKGFNTFEKNAKAPEFVLGKLIISIDQFGQAVNGELKEHITTHEKYGRQLKLDVLMGKDGRVNFTVDTYKPESKKEEAIQVQNQTGIKNNQEDIQELPF